MKPMALPAETWTEMDLRKHVQMLGRFLADTPPAAISVGSGPNRAYTEVTVRGHGRVRIVLERVANEHSNEGRAGE